MLGVLSDDFCAAYSRLWRKPVSVLAVRSYDIPILIGWGARLTTSYHPVFGVRCSAEARYRIRDSRAVLFLSLSPMLRLSPSFGANLDAAVGVTF